MASKGQLRQAYVKFYYEEAKQIIDDYNGGKIISNNDASPANDLQPPKLSGRYNSYTKKILISFLVSFFSCVIFLPIGIIGFIYTTYLAVSMPKDLKKEAEVFNEWQRNHPSQKVNSLEDINYTQIYDEEASLKESLMQKFLAVFGDFKWQKWESFFDINDLIILPDKLSLDADDCITGKYEDTNIKITEVFFGWKSVISAFMHHHAKLEILFPILLVFFFIMFFAQLSSLPDNIKILLPVLYAVFFFIVWGLGFFSIPIIFLVYLKNKKNRGLIIEIDMPKNFKGETVLFEKGFTNYMVNKKAIKKFEKTQLEDTEFNKKYSVYTTNQIETRYVLTTAFIERLKNIKFKFEASYLRMRFKNNRITIFASVHNDLFCMVKSGQKTGMKTFDVLFEEMYSVLSLVDELKLNVKTGL